MQLRTWLIFSVALAWACGSANESADGPMGPDLAGEHGDGGASSGGSTGSGTSGDTTNGSSEPGVSSTYTYYQHIKPILDARCGPCHNENGIGPFSLHDYSLAKKWAAVSASAVKARTMPPFPPDDANCAEIEDARKMSDDERRMLLDWVKGGTPEGDSQAAPQVTVDAPRDVLGEPTRTFDASEPYDPDTSKGDDYRCFLIDPKITEPWTFLQSLGIRTSNWARIHHAIVYLVPPALVASAAAVDLAEAGPGWSCYFSPKVDGVIPAGGYAPGAVQKPYPGDTTVPIQTGTQFIVELHLHEAYNEDPVEFSVATWEFPAPVDSYPGGLPMFTSNFVIPPGEPSVKAPMRGNFIAADQEPLQTDDPNAVHEAKAGLIWGADFHMHLRGKTARVELVHADGSRECLLSIPRWDDRWQGSYTFKNPIRAVAGDHVEATCEWDNSEAHQPTIDGKKLTPKELRWGVNALDEMCNSSLSLTLE